MKYFLALILALTFIADAQAAPKRKVVLMPMQLEDASLRNTMEAAVSEGLGKKYHVLSGERVAARTRDVFNAESKSAAHYCDETKCLQKIAGAFQSELIAVATVVKHEDGYFVSLTVRNIFDDTVIFSQSESCKDCDDYKVVDILRYIAEPPGKTFSEMMGWGP